MVSITSDAPSMVTSAFIGAATLFASPVTRTGSTTARRSIISTPARKNSRIASRPETAGPSNGSRSSASSAKSAATSS